MIAGGGIALLIMLMSSPVSAAAHAQHAGKLSDQGPAPSQTSETPHEPADPLGRSTPHGTLLGFLHAAQSGKYKEAAQYLQLSKKERTGDGETLASQLHQLMDQLFVGRIGAVSDNPEGSPQAGVPQDRERIGVFRIERNETSVDLVRVSDPATGNNIWLFSSDTLAVVPKLSSQIEETNLESELPRFLVSDRLFSTPLWRWIAFVVLIPVALLLASVVVGLLRGGLRIGLRRRLNPMLQDLCDSFKPPAKLILTVAFHWVGITFLGLPLLFREYYGRVAGIVLAAGLAWLIVRLINGWAERARVNALTNSGYRSGSIILLGQRILTAVVIIAAGLVMFSILGDQVIRVGETCRIGDQVGTVEDISLRSTRIRTLDSAELSVPNGQLANMKIENLSRSERNSFRTTLGLQHGTSPDQLRSLLSKIRVLLQHDARVAPEPARVRLVGFGESSLDVEIYCHILTGNWGEFLAIREDLLLRIMDLIAESGTQLALPSRTLHLAQEEALSQKCPPVPEQSAFKRRQGN